MGGRVWGVERWSRTEFNMAVLNSDFSCVGAKEVIMDWRGHRALRVKQPAAPVRHIGNDETRAVHPFSTVRSEC